MTAGAEAEGHPRARRATDVRRRTGRLVSGRQRVWLLSAAMLVAAAVFYVLSVRHLGREDTSVSAVPLLELIALFAVTEIFVVHLKFRHDAHTYSLSEIPLMLGLFYTRPEILLAAQLVGGGCVLALHRRQPAIKLVFNLAMYAVSVEAAVGMFDFVLGQGNPESTRGWGAGFAAAMTAAVIAIPAIYLAVSLSDGRPPIKDFLRPMAFALFAVSVATGIGLLAVEVAAAHAYAELLLIIPALGLHFAYRAYVQEREKHHALEFLYNSTRLFHQSPALEPALNGMLAEARTALGAELAVLAYLSMDGGIVVNRVGPDETKVRVTYVESESLAELLPLFGEGLAVQFKPAPANALLERLAGNVALRDGILVGITGASGLVGTLLVANRTSEVSGFAPTDVSLLETLAAHLDIALQNGRLEQDVAHLLALERKLTHQANHDPLTGLTNRSLFLEKVTEAIATTDRQVAVLFIDLDDFKVVNDSLGHAAGDALLVSVAERITLGIRDADAAARLGGDEFALVLDDVQDRTAAVAVAERILEVLARPDSGAPPELAASASIGIAFAERGDRTPFDAAILMRNADTAMYAAKARGKGRWAIFSPDMHEAAAYRQSLTRDFAGAIVNGEFVTYFQPIVELDTGRVVAAEALLRWMHPTRGVINPLDVVPLAEETGHMKQITETMLRLACQEAAQWSLLALDAAPAVTVNLSPRDFDDLDLVELVPSVLADAGLPPGQLIIEITESMTLADSTRCDATVRKLREHGVRLALDDFGTGYSSLSYLTRLPLNVIKIAKPFIDDLTRRPAQDSLVHGIIELGHTLNVAVIAEGIESEPQVAALRSFGCDLGQGYLYSRPIAAPQFEQWLLRRSLHPRTRLASSA